MTKEEIQKQEEDYAKVEQTTMHLMLEQTKRGIITGRKSFAQTVVEMIDDNTPMSLIRRVCDGIATNSKETIKKHDDGKYYAVIDGKEEEIVVE